MDLRVDNGGLPINDSESGQSQDPIIVTPATEPAPVLIDSNSSKINLINISDRGFTNGVLGLPQEPFAEWLEASEQLIFNESQLYEHQKKLFVGEEKLANAIDSWKGFHQETTNELDKIAENEQKQHYLEDKIKLQEADKERKNIKLIQLISIYSWVPSILLCLAGIVFIGADVGITHDIVVNALDQPDNFESWLFAFALAFVAFVFKPAFDRILEKNYQDERVRKRNHIFLGVVCCFALLTLTIMGVFRGQTDAERNQMKVLRAEQSNLEDLIGSSEDNTRIAQWNSEILTKDSQIKQMQGKVIGNSYRLWIFILSSILFAVSGTICISIGMASSEILIQKQKLNKALVAAGTFIDSLKVELKDVVISLKISSNAIERLEKQKALNPGLEILRQQVNLYETSIAADKQSILAQYIRKNTASYTDAYARGQKYSLDGALTVKLSELESKSDNDKTSPKRSERWGGEPTVNRRRRPFVMLRRIIADQYSKSSPLATMNTEIEVSDNI